MMAGREFRVPPEGLPRADRIMEAGVVLPCNHGMGDEHIGYVLDRLSAFLAGER